MPACQQCDAAYSVGVWMSALLIFMLLIARKHWSGMGWAGRLGALTACVAVFGGAVVGTYRQSQTGTTGRTCGTCLMPAISTPATAPAIPLTTVAAAGSSQTSADSSTSTTQPEVVAFYFHRTLRCHSCLEIEEWAKQAIESHFSGELAGGLIEWRPINIEEAGNEHFEKDYELTTQSLVLVRMKNGQPAEWKILQEVWELLGDHARFTQYVQTEMSAYLDTTREHGETQ